MAFNFKPKRLFKLQVQRNNVSIHLDIFCVMPVSQFEHAKMLFTEDTLWRCKPEPATKKVAAKL